MSRTLLATLLAFIVGLPAIGAQAPAGGRGAANATAAIDWNLIMFPTNRSVPIDRQRKDPVKLFDNLYSVGVQTVCAFLIPTSNGLVLVDTTYPETAELLLDNIRKAGFDPASIRFIFSTHAATDHFGAAGRIKQVARGARVGMPLADWEEAERLMARRPEGSPLVPMSRDLVLSDGQTFAVGDTTFKFYVLPGRTPGSLAIEYLARDGARTYRALHNGAYGTPQPSWGEAYLKSITRLKTLGPYQVWLPNHPWMALPRDLQDIEKAMATRAQSAHPAVVSDPKLIDDQLDFIHALISRKVAIEQYQGIR
jgi:glyoxylase-like metal-dependent hydrolase (beta-lactamase superfamily II)